MYNAKFMIGKIYLWNGELDSMIDEIEKYELYSICTLVGGENNAFTTI